MFFIDWKYHDQLILFSFFAEKINIQNDQEIYGGHSGIFPKEL